jgi:hypothetical protein
MRWIEKEGDEFKLPQKVEKNASKNTLSKKLLEDFY